MIKQTKLFCLLFAVLGLYIWLATLAQQQVRYRSTEEMSIALPKGIQIALALGDNYLAANIAGFRALVVSTQNMGKDQYAILAKVQQDVADLNPRHEDNYYIAAAILPWEGQLNAAQKILHQANLTRTFDWQPAFYEGFNTYHFLKDPKKAAKILEDASKKTNNINDKLTLLNIAARWYEKGYSPEFAENIVTAMAKQSHHPEFKAYLLTRAERLKTLTKLRHAATDYKNQFGRSANSFQELIQAEKISTEPVDPFGFGYFIDKNGIPQLLNKKETK